MSTLVESACLIWDIDLRLKKVKELSIRSLIFSSRIPYSLLLSLIFCSVLIDVKCIHCPVLNFKI
jgi:hypothetical protein